MPSVSVFDPDGRLPLNLQRTGLTENRYPFDDILAGDVILDFLAYCLVHGPSSIPNNSSVAYAGLTTPFSRSGGSWYFTDKGFGYSDASILHSLGVETLLVAKLPEVTGAERIGPLVFGPTIILSSSSHSSKEEEWLRSMIEFGRFAEGSFSSRSAHLGRNKPDEAVLDLMKRKGARVLISASEWARIVDMSRVRKSLRKLLVEEWTENGSHLFAIGNCPPATFDFGAFVSTKTLEKGEVVVEMYLDLADEPEPSPISSQWLKILKCAEIPYDPWLRRTKLKHAYKELEAYVQPHEAVKDSGRKR